MFFSDARWVCELLKCAEHSMFLLLMHIVCNFWGNIFAENAGMCLWMKLHLTSCLSYCRLVSAESKDERKNVSLTKLWRRQVNRHFLSPILILTPYIGLKNIDTLHWALGSKLVILFACRVCKNVDLWDKIWFVIIFDWNRITTVGYLGCVRIDRELATKKWLIVREVGISCFSDQLYCQLELINHMSFLKWQLNSMFIVLMPDNWLLICKWHWHKWSIS